MDETTPTRMRMFYDGVKAISQKAFVLICSVAFLYSDKWSRTNKIKMPPVGFSLNLPSINQVL